jgi:hypothetical protein
VGLRETGLLGVDDAAAGVLEATGTRSRKVVSEKLLSFSETVRVTAGEPAGPVARSVLAARLTADASAAGEPDDSGSAGDITKSRPKANCAAPEISTRAMAPDIPIVSRDISCPAV